MSTTAYQFEYNGGVWKPTDHTTEKFLLFFVVGGKEVSFHQAKREGLVAEQSRGVQQFSTGLNVAKLFVGEQGFGIRKRYHSFYLRLSPKQKHVVTIKSFSNLDNGSPYFFKGTVNFLKNAEALELLDPDATSARFIGNQRALPVALLREMVAVDKSALRKGVRHIKIGKGVVGIDHREIQ